MASETNLKNVPNDGSKQGAEAPPPDGQASEVPRHRLATNQPPANSGSQQSLGTNVVHSSAAPGSQDGRLKGYTILKRSTCQVRGLESDSEDDALSETDSYEHYDDGSYARDQFEDFSARTASIQTISNSRETERDVNNSLQDGGFTMFNPVAIARPKFTVLNKEQQVFVNRYFTEVVPDDDVSTAVLENAPVPDLDCSNKRS